jgi:hypothetical protein
MLHSSLEDCNSSMLNYSKQTPNGTRPHALRTTSLHEYQCMKVCDGAFMIFHAFSFESSCKRFLRANWSEVWLRVLPFDCNLVVILLGPPLMSTMGSSLLMIGSSSKW